MPGKLTIEHVNRPGLRGSVADRFWASVQVTNSCWLWTKTPSPMGYGRISTPVSPSSQAHHISYLIHHGPIATGLVIDHICRNRLCVNPAHLRAVTPRVNSLENSLAPTAINAAKTICVNGHPLSGRNLRIDKRGWRACRKCQVAHSKKHKQAHLTAGATHDR